jgi:hypothetical protein
MQPKDIVIYQVNYNSHEKGRTINDGAQFFLGQISILMPSNGGDPIFYNEYKTFEQSK